MIENESDLGVVCTLAHKYLGERGPTHNEVLRRLPRDFAGNVDELAKEINTSVDVPPLFQGKDSCLSFIFNSLVMYQSQQGHHQPISRLKRMISLDNHHAKRVICELFKAWVCQFPNADDDGVDAAEVESYSAFVTHLLYYNDRWSNKLWAKDTLVETLVGVNRKLQELKRAVTGSKHKYLKVLERIHEWSCELIDHALRVAILGVTDCHSELEQYHKRKGLTLKSLSQPCNKGPSAFWCTDMGQVIYAALVRADPENFKPAASLQQWTVWTDELGTIRMYEYAAMWEAQQEFDRSKCCAVLVGPEGILHDKNWTTNQMLSNVLKAATGAMDGLKRRVDQHLRLQWAVEQRDRVAIPEPASGTETPKHLATLDDWLGGGGGRGDAKEAGDAKEGEEDPAATSSSDNGQGQETAGLSPRAESTSTTAGNGETSAPPAEIAWDAEVQRVRDKWMQMETEHAGIAEPFRGCKRIKWMEGVFEEEARSSDFPTIILNVPKRLSDLIQTHVEVMGAMRGMICEGGSKEALAAIYALRQRSSITGLLADRMHEFLESAALLHGFFQNQLFKELEAGRRIKGQVAYTQRLYLDSYNSCASLRDSILREWHQLGMEVSDAGLAEEAKRIDVGEREAFSRLMSLPQALPCLGDVKAGAQQLRLENARMNPLMLGDQTVPDGTPRCTPRCTPR